MKKPSLRRLGFLFIKLSIIQMGVLAFVHSKHEFYDGASRALDQLFFDLGEPQEDPLEHLS